MGKFDNLFDADGDHIELHGIESLAQICRYHPSKKDQFFDGLELADDLTGPKGVTLYTSGTNITQNRIQRLMNLQDNNPEMDMNFKIKRSAQLINNFKEDITTRMKKLLEHRKNYKVYSGLLGSIEKDLTNLVDDIFSDENIVLSIFKMKFTANLSSSKNSMLFFNHTVSVALFAFAIAQSRELLTKVNFTGDDLKELVKAAFFHNIGSVINVEDIIVLGQEKQKEKYNEFNRTSANNLGNVRLGFDAVDAIRHVAEYHYDRREFVTREDNKGCWMANIILVADMYLQMETGLFGVKKKPSHIVDNLNLKTTNNEVNKAVVQSLTLGMNLKDIFDFYMEMENLKNMCDVKGGKHALPYPLTGFKSPTIFVCKINNEECDHYEKSVKAVTLMRPMGELKEGKYARCLLTTPKLIAFYEEHYEEIKKDMAGRDTNGG